MPGDPSECLEQAKTCLRLAAEAPNLKLKGVAALNRKIIEIAHRNLNSGFDLATSLVTAKNLAEVVELRAIYWHRQPCGSGGGSPRVIRQDSS